MLLEVKHTEFTNQKVEVKTGGLFSGPKLMLDGSELKKTKGMYSVPSSTENEIQVQLKYNFLDPIPKVKIKDEVIEIAKPLTWFEYVWIGLPILLVFAGGAIGGLCGGAAATTSGRLFRSDKGAIAKYGLSALLTLGAVLGYVIIVTALQLALAE